MSAVAVDAVVDTASTTRLLERLRESGIEVDASARRRSEYAYEASNYRVRPVAVIFPRSAAEVCQILRDCAELHLPVTTRGGGTSMAGNAIGPGVIIDVSRYLTRIEPIAKDATSVWVGAGVVLNELRLAVEAATAGRSSFAPDPSSHSRATIGGSIGNDACGNHSVEHGRITHHVLELELVTIDGAHLVAAAGTIRAFDVADAFSARRAAELESSLRVLTLANLAKLRLELERLPRQVSGYRLGQLLPENGTHFARALAGSEGTCAIIVGARVGLVPRRSAAALLCLGYDSAVESARDVPPILEFAPSAVEGLDSSIVDIMRGRRGPESVAALPEGRAYLMVEFAADSIAAAVQRSEALLQRLGESRRYVAATLVTDPGTRAKLWSVRENGAGLASRRLDGVQTWGGWEDSAVPPERLADYLAALTELVAELGYAPFIYGHFGAGCVHMRLDYDLWTSAGRDRFAHFTRRAAALVVEHGGSLSGEHGDGRARSELLSLMYSPDMLALFAQFKRTWDPSGLLNPGIIVAPAPFTESLALEGAPRPTEGPAELNFAGNSHACIGVARCRSTSHTFMCPSFRASKDEKDSTRARARVLQEFARDHGSTRGAWSSSEVRESLDLCLSCKACSNDCPTGVDIAEAKSVIVDEHYRGRIRPFTHYAIGWLPRWLPLLTRLAPLANWAAQRRFLRGIGDRLGVSAQRKLPAFVSRRKAAEEFRRARFVSSGDVVLFVDSFTRAFRPHLVPAASRVLAESGASVSCSATECCGLTWISTGQRGAARRRLARLVRTLDDGSERPIVVVEPSCAATMRDDGPKLVRSDAAERVAARVRSFAAHTAEAMAAGWTPSAPAPRSAVLQTHCHEHAVFGPETQRNALKRWGVTEVIESSSCCGVAGNFGFETEHFDFSMSVAAHSIQLAMAKASSDAPVLTDGFGCSMQVGQLERESVHLAELMDPARVPQHPANRA